MRSGAGTPNAAARRLGARAVRIDVTDEASVRATAEAIEPDGGLDVLVNNARIQHVDSRRRPGSG